MEQQASTIEIFGCYARKDRKLREELEKHLSPLKNHNIVTTLWHDGVIGVGTEWEQEIRKHLDSAQIILLLISSDFINSRACYREMERALERHRANEARVISILLRPVHWSGAPFAHLQLLPTDARAITTWSNRDAAFTNVVKGICHVIEDLTGLTGLSDEISVSENPQLVDSTSPSTRPGASVPLPPTPKNPSRKRRWLPVIIVACVVLLSILGTTIIPTPWHPNPTFFMATTATPDASATATAATAIAACTAMPILIEPVDGQTLNSRTIMFTWEPPQDCRPDGYTVRFTTNPDPEVKPLLDKGWAPTYYKYTFLADGTYYWHIRACKPCTPFHPGGWAKHTFTIHTSPTS